MPQSSESLIRKLRATTSLGPDDVEAVERLPINTKKLPAQAAIGRRLETVGLSNGNQFDLPMTQIDMADALGLSAVHVNRVVQELRRDGLLELRKQSVSLRDLPRLKEVAEFDDLYLHQNPAL